MYKYLIITTLFLIQGICHANSSQSSIEKELCTESKTKLNISSTNVDVCHPGYVDITQEAVSDWNKCEQMVVYINNLIYMVCFPESLSEFRITNGSLEFKHFVYDYPGFEKSATILEKIDLTTMKYKLSINSTKNNNHSVSQAVSMIYAEIDKPFDGNSYFRIIYSNLFKLRDYAIENPQSILDILLKFKSEKVFDGEVAETLSDVIDEVKFIQKRIATASDANKALNQGPRGHRSAH